ncbi:MAG: zinc ribbon domain-containing protein [Clostridia bacterium]|nr:zinc ribbon domain-containing protein [Clostridia bacterium]MBQ7121824.1 zinc ribbon domain-containing protein [Clostridia bacterium]
MYCPKCGKQLAEGSTVCVDCGPVINTVQKEYKPKKKFFNAPGKAAKSYAAIFSACLVFPASICTVIDFLVHRHDYWFDFVVGALLLAWVVFVYPVLGVTRPAVNGVIIFCSIMAYTLYVSYRTGQEEWITQFAMPLILLTAGMIALDVSLIGGKHIKGFHIVSLLAIESAVYFVALEAMVDNLFKNSIELKWSIIIACLFVSVVAFAEAFSYVGRINRKDKNK